MKTYREVAYLVDAWLFGMRIITGKNGLRYDKHINKVLDTLTASEANIIPRIPMIPSFFDQEEILQSIAELLKNHSITTVCFNQWNKDYDTYYTQSGTPLAMKIPSENEIKECETKITSYFFNLNFKSYENN